MAESGKSKPWEAMGVSRATYYRNRKKESHSLPDLDNIPPPDRQAGELAKWASKSLIVPPGHPRSGEPMALPDFGVRFLHDALQAREALLSVSRKNGKSSVIAVLLLGHLAGPLRRRGWRAGVVSVNREKAGELWLQCEGISEASGLGKYLEFGRAPRTISSLHGTVDFLSADRSSGHASGFDLALVDELGLLRERDRDLVNGMRSSTSARDGKFIGLSIQGGAPFTKELLARKGSPGVAVHHYAAAEDCRIDDEAAWAAANPGLGTIKSMDYMRHEAARVLATPADQASFRAFDLNTPGAPSREMIVTLPDWKGCVVPVDELPPRQGACTVGLDLGGSSSMTAAAAFWHRTGRLETWGAFPATPKLRERGDADAVGDLYERMADRGELQVYDGRVTPAGVFLQDVAARLAGEQVLACGFDRFRRAEAIQALEAAGVRWRLIPRGMGAHARADGSADVRAFQKMTLSGKLRVAESLLLASAVSESSIRRDGSGNPALDKARDKGRIDALSATVIACGLGELVSGNSDSGEPVYALARAS